MKKIRVLLSAFAFSPYRGSECAVGWNIATHLAGLFDVTVLTGDVSTAKKTLTDLNRYFATNPPIPGLDIQYVAPSKHIIAIEKLHTLPGAWMLYYSAYRRWQLLAYRRAVQLHAANAFDICHNLTFIGYREPGYLHRLRIPFVWGPISGAENFPPAFYQSLSWAELFRPFTRDLANRFQARFPGRIRTAAMIAKKVFAVSNAEKNLLAKWGIESELMLETGNSKQPLAKIRTKDPKEPLKIIWSGLFTPRKALPLLFRALSRIHELGICDCRWELIILGDGPMRSLWRREAESTSLSHRISWLGRLERQDAINKMSESDLLVHTGLREGTPHVILEALSLGLPVICHDAGGMGTAINCECGIKVPLRDPETSIDGFSRAIVNVLNRPEILEALSFGAINRANELSWESIARRLGDAYHSVLKLQATQEPAISC